jgi:hypothetical protein
MKSCLCALLVFIFSSLAAHADPDPRLVAALRTLRDRVSVRTEVDRAARAGLETPVAVLALTTAMALSTRIPGFAAFAFPARPGVIIAKAAEASTYAVSVGGLMYFGAKLYKLGRAARERGLPLNYHEPKGLRRYLDAPLDEQLLIAERDPAFATFLITLADSLETLENGFAPPVPAGAH